LSDRHGEVYRLIAYKVGQALSNISLVFKNATEEDYNDVNVIGDDLDLLDQTKQMIIDYERLLVNRVLSLNGVDGEAL